MLGVPLQLEAAMARHGGTYQVIDEREEGQASTSIYQIAAVSPSGTLPDQHPWLQARNPTFNFVYSLVNAKRSPATDNRSIALNTIHASEPHGARHTNNDYSDTSNGVFSSGKTILTTQSINRSAAKRMRTDKVTITDGDDNRIETNAIGSPGDSVNLGNFGSASLKNRFRTKSTHLEQPKHDQRFHCPQPACHVSCKREVDLSRHISSIHGPANDNVDKYYRCIDPNCAHSQRLQGRQDKFRLHIEQAHSQEDVEKFLDASMVCLPVSYNPKIAGSFEKLLERRSNDDRLPVHNPDTTSLPYRKPEISPAYGDDSRMGDFVYYNMRPESDNADRLVNAPLDRSAQVSRDVGYGSLNQEIPKHPSPLHNSRLGFGPVPLPVREASIISVIDRFERAFRRAERRQTSHRGRDFNRCASQPPSVEITERLYARTIPESQSGHIAVNACIYRPGSAPPQTNRSGPCDVNEAQSTHCHDRGARSPYRRDHGIGGSGFNRRKAQDDDEGDQYSTGRIRTKRRKSSISESHMLFPCVGHGHRDQPNQEDEFEDCKTTRARYVSRLQ